MAVRPIGTGELVVPPEPLSHPMVDEITDVSIGTGRRGVPLIGADPQVCLPPFSPVRLTTGRGLGCHRLDVREPCADEFTSFQVTPVCSVTRSRRTVVSGEQVASGPRARAQPS